MQHRRAAVIGWVVAGAILRAGIAQVVVPMLGNEQSKAQPQPGPLVETAMAQRGKGGVAVTQSAFARAADLINAAPEVAGRVARISPAYTSGARVAARTVLVELADGTHCNTVARAQAQVRQAEARLEQARKTLSRQQKLQDRDFASETALQEAQTVTVQPEGDLALARAQECVVTSVTVSPGQLVQPGKATGQIARADHAKLPVGLSERQFTTLWVTRRSPAMIGLIRAALDTRVFQNLLLVAGRFRFSQSLSRISPISQPALCKFPSPIPGRPRRRCRMSNYNRSKTASGRSRGYANCRRRPIRGLVRSVCR